MFLTSKGFQMDFSRIVRMSKLERIRTNLIELGLSKEQVDILMRGVAYKLIPYGMTLAGKH